MNDEKEPETRNWTMPEWMEPYRKYIRNTGGNPVEDLVNDTNANIRNNVIRAALCVAVESQVELLTILHREGLLPAASDVLTPERKAAIGRAERAIRGALEPSESPMRTMVYLTSITDADLATLREMAS